MNYHTDDWIMEQVRHHHALVLQRYPVIGTFLFGSQNYGADTPISDVDTFSFVPSGLMDKDEIAVPEDGGNAYVYDIQYLIDGVRGSCLQWFEPLYTKYYIGDIEQLRQKRDEIVYLCPRNFYYWLYEESKKDIEVTLEHKIYYRLSLREKQRLAFVSGDYGKLFSGHWGDDLKTAKRNKNGDWNEILLDNKMAYLLNQGDKTYDRSIDHFLADIRI